MTARLADSAAAPSATGSAPKPDGRADPGADPGANHAADLEAVLAAAVTSAVGESPDGRPLVLAEQITGRVTEQLAACVSAVRGLAQDRGRAPADWSRFGQVVPVLSGSPGAGASVVTAALADLLQRSGRCVLIVDASDPARSGLAAAAAADGPWTTPVTSDLAIRYSWRRYALLARLEARLPAITPGMVPPPEVWLPQAEPLHATVADLGHDGWRIAANPLVGAGGWLRRGTPSTRPILVVRPTRPSLWHAEQVLARLDPWIRLGLVTPPRQLVVTGVRRWPRGVPGAAGGRVAPLVESALFVPHDGELEIGGVTAAAMSARVLNALVPLLADTDLGDPEPGAAQNPRRPAGDFGRRRCHSTR
jgi:hypothetical protein